MLRVVPSRMFTMSMATQSIRRRLIPGAYALLAAAWLAGTDARAANATGEALYDTCAACHGVDGAGVSDGSVPAIAGQHLRVLVRQLEQYRHGRRWDPRMEHFAAENNLATPQQLADVARYISSLRPVAGTAAGDGVHRAYGSRVYAQRCASCHGATAQGSNARGMPRLAGQHYAYLLRQLHDTVEGRRPNLRRDHRLLFSDFQQAEFEGLADYLSRLRPAGAR